ncbi:transmembrane protein 217-like [Heterodontus francisci]|uniref:transmembrane protein 217-like n=1 Tax=Heterodontus francisci TaxID=7792 RepID=UPI00355B0020
MLTFHSFRVKLKRLVAGEVCGLNAKEGTIVAGLFMLMVSIMQLIFEVGHLRHFKTMTNAGSANNSTNRYSSQLFCIGSIAFICMTFIAVFLLFLSIWKEKFWGVGGYIIWIFIYELAQICFLATALPYQVELPDSVRALEWFGLTMRLISHIFWLMFVTVHAIDLYKISRNADDPLKSTRMTPPKLKFAKVKELAM